MGKRRLVALLLVVGVALSGCTADPTELATDECISLATSPKYREDPEPAQTVEIAEVTVNVMKAEHPAFSISGRTEVTYPDGSTDSVKWSCFAQVIDDKTYADIQYAILESSGKSSTD